MIYTNTSLPAFSAIHRIAHTCTLTAISQANLGYVTSVVSRILTGLTAANLPCDGLPFHMTTTGISPKSHHFFNLILTPEKSDVTHLIAVYANAF